MNKAIEPYFKYYEKKYPPEILGDAFFIEIPIKDGCASLDNYYINPLIDQGYKISENFLLGYLYLIKPF